MTDDIATEVADRTLDPALDSAWTRARAALEESVRRVASIAVVHDTLAGSREDVVVVDDVLDRVLPQRGDLTVVGPAARAFFAISVGGTRSLAAAISSRL